ncbi:MAG: sigma-70 family RNA polymerase sigma factor [Verrucomicrobiota bacterium]
MPQEDRHDEFMMLFLENQPRIYGYIRSLLFQKADADDVMQETASVLWRKFDDFERGTQFDRWALRTAYHQVRYFRQKKARESKRLQFSDDLVELLSTDVVPILDSTEDAAAALESCLRKLAEKDRQLIALRYEEGGTNRAVARTVGKSESVVSRNLSRIYESLMRCIAMKLKLESPA